MSNMCDVCDENAATVTCEECGMALCAEDDVSVHKPAKLAGHVRVPVNGASQTAPTSSPAAASAATPAAAAPAAAPAAAATAAPAKDVLCELCEEVTATTHCEECDQDLCTGCCDDLHKPARMTAHVRRPLGGGAVPEKAASPAPTTAASAPAPAPVASSAPSASASASPSPPAPSTPAPATPPQGPSAFAIAPAPLDETMVATPVKASVADEEEEKSNGGGGGGDDDADGSFSTPLTKRTLAASQSEATLPRSGRPRSSRSTRSSASTARKPVLEVPASLAFAPRALQQALSPARNVLSMSAGSRWEEPDLRPYQGPPGTFGCENRDGSPKKNRNLLYSKSASDLLTTSGGGNPTWQRLAKPKVFVSSVISPLFDDIKQCTFKPSISPLSSTIAPGAFPDRLAQSVKVYKDRQMAPEGSGWMDPEATFKPRLNAFRLEKLTTAPPFLDRLKEDLADRKTKLKAIEATQQFPFHPTISASSKKRVSAITTPFLDRLKEDLDAREDGQATRKAEAERLPYSFQPNPDRLAHQRYSFNVFLGRMENDLDERKTKYDERCRRFGLPNPHEVAALVRGGSAPGKRK